MPQSLPQMPPVVLPKKDDLLYTVLDAGGTDRDRKMTLLQLFQAFLSGEFVGTGGLPDVAWTPGQPTTLVPVYRNVYPSGEIESGWMNLRELHDGLSCEETTWDLSGGNLTVDLSTGIEGNLAIRAINAPTAARTLTLSGALPAGREVRIFISATSLLYTCTIKAGATTLTTVKGRELVRVHWTGGAPVYEKIGNTSLTGLTDMTWLPGATLEGFFTGLGYSTETPDGDLSGSDLNATMTALGLDPRWEEDGPSQSYRNTLVNLLRSLDVTPDSVVAPVGRTKHFLTVGSSDVMENSHLHAAVTDLITAPSTTFQATTTAATNRGDTMEGSAETSVTATTLDVFGPNCIHPTPFPAHQRVTISADSGTFTGAVRIPLGVPAASLRNLQPSGVQFLPPPMSVVINAVSAITLYAPKAKCRVDMNGGALVERYFKLSLSANTSVLITRDALGRVGWTSGPIGSF